MLNPSLCLWGRGLLRKTWGAGQSMGLGVRGHELQALPRMTHRMAWLVTSKAQEYPALSREGQKEGSQPEGVGVCGESEATILVGSPPRSSKDEAGGPVRSSARDVAFSSPPPTSGQEDSPCLSPGHGPVCARGRGWEGRERGPSTAGAGGEATQGPADG